MSVYFFLINFSFLRNGLNGIDIWKWIHYSLQIKENNYKIPQFMKGYLDIKPFNYPPLFLLIMSLLPKTIIEKRPYILIFIFFIIESFVVLWGLGFNGFQLFFGGAFILVISYDRLNYFSTRPLASLIVTLIFFILNLEIQNSLIHYLLLFSAFALLFFSHRHSLQFLFFLLITRTILFTNDSIILLTFLSTFLILMLLSKVYRRVFLNHYSILTHYFEKINIVSNSQLRYPFKFDWKRFLHSIIFSKLTYLLVIIYTIYLSNASLFNIQIFALVFVIIYCFAKCFRLFSFLGEPERNFDYILFPVMLSYQFFTDKVKIIFLCLAILMLVARILYNSFNKKNIYRKNFNTSKLDSVVLENFQDKDSFNFMSYPALFDDYVNYKYKNSKVFFHDNGLSAKFSKIRYVPEFLGIELKDEYIEEIVKEYNIDMLVIHDRFDKFITPFLTASFAKVYMNEKIDYTIYVRKKESDTVFNN